MFAFCVGTCYVFLQYLANLGYVTIHWDRVEQKYNRHMDVDKDGKVTNRDVQSKWNTLIAVLTNNIQFKSTFLAGFYVGLRYS
jgi:uncharacterized membrane protein (Fun14 family)